MNIPEYYEGVSLSLTEVLDASGLRDDLRWRRINTWLQIEELDRILMETISGTEAHLYYFGSQAEATTTQGLWSDIDTLILISNCEVLQDLQFWRPSLDTTTFLMVADESTPPGYVKLQLVQGDVPMPVCNYQDDNILLDEEGRSVLYNGFARAIIETVPNQFVSHGPAITMWSMGRSVDAVCAIPSRSWPDQISQRMSTARRNSNWPSRRMMDAIKQTAVLLVPVGQKSSPEQHLEWRPSFSFAEKLMMMQFNSTQYKCYVMLKFIKKSFINVDAVEDVLTSYHCKTCMFYLIQDTPASLWHPNNLMLCLDMCLRQILSWVQCAKCPNYFIPDENMFLGKLAGPVQGKIASILQDLLRQSGRYIIKISYENIGKNVYRVCQSLRMELDCPDEKILAHTIVHLVNILNILCGFCVHINICQLSFLKSHYGPRYEIDNVLRSLFCSALGNHLASQSLKQEMYNQENLIAANELLLRGSSSDVASGKLKLAAFCLALGKLETMEELLNQVDANWTHIVCGQGDIIIKLGTLSKIVHEDITTSQFIQTCLAFMVYYIISDIHIVPKVLIFEIFRSTGSELSLDLSRLIPSALVKARDYLYFLQYQCFHLQGRVAQRFVALNNLIWVSKDNFQKLLEIMDYTPIMFVRHRFHTEMALRLDVVTNSLNLMAYCLKQDGRAMHAFKVLCVSMKLKHHHNAAKWQITTFINSVIRTVWTRR